MSAIRGAGDRRPVLPDDAVARRRLAERLRRIQQDRQATFPLTPAQQGMWFQQQRDPGNTAYNIPLAFCLHGEAVDPAPIVRDCLAAVVARHDALRTVFLPGDDGVMQEVLTAVDVHLGSRVMPALAEGEAWADAVPAMSRAQAAAPFDLACAPLFRFDLVRVAPDLHILLATFHHIVMDGWSIGVFLNDFAQAFIGLIDGGEPAFAPLPLAYRDYVHEQRSHAASATSAEDLDYWVRRLRDAPTTLSLPVEFARPKLPRHRGATFEFRFPTDVSRRLGSLSAARGATPFMGALASFHALLLRLSGQSDMTIGVSTANRGDRRTWPMLGLFSDVLPIRLSAMPAASFHDLLATTRQACLNDYDHAGVALTRIVEALGGERRGGRGDLFQVGFDFQNTPWADVVGSHVTLLNGDAGAAKLDFNLNLSTDHEDLVGVFEYDTDLFSRAAVARFVDVYQRLLAGMLDFPDHPVATIDVAGAACRRALVQRQLDAAPAPGDVVDPLDALERIAGDRPAAVAIESTAEAITYAMLRDRCDIVARALIGAGVAAGSRIGLSCGRGATFVQAVLGVLRAGAAFVPLDPELPDARRRMMVEDSGIGLVLVDAAHAAAWPALDGVQVLVIEELANVAGASEAELRTAWPERPDAQPAYVIYTSGTTARPKGVVVGHGALRAFCTGARAVFGLAAGDRVLRFASIGFDTSLEEILPCLLAGATLVVDEAVRGGTTHAFLGACARLAVTVLNLPTAFWHELADVLGDEGAPALPEGLRLVVIGGEAALPRAIARWRRHAPPAVRLLNTYGPTETTISVSHADLQAGGAHDERRARVPIGAPNPGVFLHVVDAAGALLPPGLYGEILVGGPSVALGYQNLPEETASRFLSDHIVPVAGGRMYRTGDIGRLLEDGRVEYGGRNDDQVKLLGVRVEPVEIEDLLRSAPGVSAAAVVVERRSDAPARLIAYVCMEDGYIGERDALRAWARERLPVAMRPACYVALRRRPLTLSGKIDRAALPAPGDTGDADVAGTDIAPRNPEEAMIAGLWASLLGVERVGVDRSFFELGGHSLLVVRMLSRLRRATRVDVPVAAMFAAPTVAGLARTVRTMRASACGPLAPIPMRGATTAGLRVFRQSLAQQRLWFLQSLAPADTAYNNQSVLRIDGALDVEALASALSSVVERHEVLRSAFVDADGVPVQRVEPATGLSLARLDLSALAESLATQRLEEAIRDDAATAFDLASGRPLRAMLVRLAEDRHVLVFNWHHIVTDAWSLSIVVDEIAALYAAVRGGHAARLPAVQIQYGDYAEWEHQQMEGERLSSQLAYWRGALKDAPQRVPLPAPTRAVPPEEAWRSGGVLPATTGAALAALARRQDASMFMAGLAVFAVLLAKVSGQASIVVGTPVSSRTREELEQTVGYFLNTLPIRCELGGDPDFAAVLAAVREAAVAAYANADVPFERLVQELADGGRTDASPLFNVMFVLEHDSDTTDARLGDAVLTPLARGGQRAKFDLALAMRVQVDDRITFEWEADTSRVDSALAAAIAALFPVFLERLCATPDVPLSRMPLLPDIAAPDAGPAAAARCIHHLVETQARATPTARAVVHGDAYIDYATLNARANRLAHWLVAQGAGRDATVALCLTRSITMVVSILAVWKANAAYVPLEPTLPRARLAGILEDAIPTCLLTDAAAAAAAGEGAIDLDSPAMAEALAACPDTDPGHNGADPSQLAYVIYTSGSTGTPKGVMVEHRALANLAVSIRDWLARMDVPAAHACAWNASFAFDVSLQGLLQLGHGATLHVVDDALRRDPAALCAYLEAQAIDSIDLTPWQADALLAHAPEGARLPVLVVAGEAIGDDLWNRLARCHGGVSRAINAYGPTEACVYATATTIEAAVAPHIGRPLAGTVARIVDLHGAPLPDGIAGELQLGGAGVARGYLHRDDLTAARFLQADRLRWYATGDIARVGVDGNLEFHGRADCQVKVRGYRIELGEIEHRLRSAPGVASAVVVAPAGGDGQRSLVGYAVLAPGWIGDVVWQATTRHILLKHLPDYMVPAHLVALEAWPLTANGKLDLSSLPAPDLAATQGTYVALATPTERQLAGIWASLFGIDANVVGAGAGFFALGGHSLLLVRLATAIRSATGVDMPLRALFDAPDLRAMAAEIDAASSAAQAGTAPDTDLVELEW